MLGMPKIVEMVKSDLRFLKIEIHLGINDEELSNEELIKEISKKLWLLLKNKKYLSFINKYYGQAHIIYKIPTNEKYWKLNGRKACALLLLVIGFLKIIIALNKEVEKLSNELMKASSLPDEKRRELDWRYKLLLHPKGASNLDMTLRIFKENICKNHGLFDDKKIERFLPSEIKNYEMEWLPRYIKSSFKLIVNEISKYNLKNFQERIRSLLQNLGIKI